MLKMRRSCDRLIFNMGIPIPGKYGLYIETGPWFKHWQEHELLTGTSCKWLDIKMCSQSGIIVTPSKDITGQCGKLNFWSTRPKTSVPYIMFYKKFHSPRPTFYSPSSKCTRIGERASVSFPHCRGMNNLLWGNSSKPCAAATFQ